MSLLLIMVCHLPSIWLSMQELYNYIPCSCLWLLHQHGIVFFFTFCFLILNQKKRGQVHVPMCLNQPLMSYKAIQQSIAIKRLVEYQSFLSFILNDVDSKNHFQKPSSLAALAVQSWLYRTTKILVFIILLGRGLVLKMGPEMTV